MEFDEVITYRPVVLSKKNFAFLTHNRGKLYLWIVDIQTERKKRFELRINQKRKAEFKGYFLTFGFNSKHLIICSDKKVYIGEFSEKNKIIKLNFVCKTETGIRFLKLFNDYAILSNYGYRAKPAGYDANTIIYLLSLKDFSIKTLDLGTPYGFYFSLFYPPEFVDFSGQYIAHSHINKYQIDIYDHNGHLKTQINKKDSLFNNIIDDIHLKFKKILDDNPTKVKIALDSMRQVFFGGIGIIEKINFINDSLLLVRWWGPKTDTSSLYPNIYYDIWTINDCKPKLLVKNVLAKKINDSTLMGCMPLYSSRYESGDNFILGYSSLSYSIEPSNPSETFGEFLKKNNFNLPNPVLSISVYEKINN